MGLTSRQRGSNTVLERQSLDDGSQLGGVEFVRNANHNVVVSTALAFNLPTSCICFA